ncbi:MAG: UbiH/UbiF/VisC/COQ6 family ubiquinone biosynthesis hydroxylase [Alphaproteobacteria bacterium]|nr:UbiH/UbiF/VisC/COQ6 family ubiquinone biosynthesis hydroxylase [Alphaproteobacteria bacterium]
MAAQKNPGDDSAVNPLYDALIVGGGLAGLSLACLLGARGMKIGCIDRMAPDNTAPQDLRTTAISYGSRKILERAGIWAEITQSCPIEDIRILDGASPVLLQFLHTEVEGQAFGWIVNNSDLKRAMMKRLGTLPGVQHIAPARVADFEIQSGEGPKSAFVILDDGRRFGADLIIGADGRESFTRKWMDVPVRRWRYDQQAVICTVAHENAHQNTAIEHFWPQGPFAVLPMADGPEGQHRSSVVFTEHKHGQKSWMTLSDSDFEIALAARFPAYYGDVRMIGPRAAFPLSLVHAAEYIRPRMVLVADAAHGIHPIAGQGLNLGFRDLDTLDRLVGEAFSAGEDIGSLALLETYQRRRRPDNMAMVAVTDGLVRLFSTAFPPAALLRRVGLRVVAKLGPARRFFMKQAMGDR